MSILNVANKTSYDVMDRRPVVTFFFENDMKQTPEIRFQEEKKSVWPYGQIIF